MNQPSFFFAITAIAMTSTITADAMMILVVMLPPLQPAIRISADRRDYSAAVLSNDLGFIVEI